MSNLVEYKVPELAILESEKKIRDYSPEEAKGRSAAIVNTLLMDLGVSSKADTNQHIRSVMFIIDGVKNYTFEEVIKAFTLFIAGEFREKPLQQLNPLVIGKVMTEYEGYKREKLKAHRRKIREMDVIIDEYTPEQKEAFMNEAITMAALEYSREGELKGVVTHIYDYMDKQGKLQGKRSDKEWDKYKIEAHKKAKVKARGKLRDNSLKDLSLKKGYRAALEAINTGKHDSLIPLAKKMILEEYFKKNV